MNVLKLPIGTIEDESELAYIEDESELAYISYGGYQLSQLWHKKCEPRMWHRLRGPACIYSDGEEVWYRDGIHYTPTAHELMMWEFRKKNECS